MPHPTPTPASPARPTPNDGGTSESLRVLVADKFEQSGLDTMVGMGCTVAFEPDLKDAALVERLAAVDPDVVVVRSTKLDADALAAGPRLSLVIRAGAGYDTIDVAAASRRGIFVANCPGKNAEAVAELAWGLILACDRRIPDQTIDLRRRTWDKKGYAKARGLHGRTLGVVGLGRIGEGVAQRGRAFGMRVVAWSRSLTPERAHALGVEAVSTPEDVARAADVVSVHVAATSDTAHLVGPSFCAAMKPGAILVNTTRGSVLDEAAVADAVREKGLRVGLDVYAEEPGAGDSAFTAEIVQLPGVYGTHHVGASTDQAQEAIAAETTRILGAYARTGAVPNCVNRAASSPATCLLTVRHLNRTGVLAHVFHVLSGADINVEEMENVIYEGAEAACARIQLDATPGAAELDEIGRNAHILSTNLAHVAR